MISQHSKKAWRNPWVLGMVGLIIMVLVVDGFFIWLSTHNRSTLVDHEYSTKDRRSDSAELREITVHRALGWQTTVTPPPNIVMNTPAAYEILVTDRSGAPVSGTMEVEAYRPSDAEADFTTPFAAVAPGVYRGSISFPLKGYWELRIRVKRGEDMFEVNTKKFAVAAGS